MMRYTLRICTLSLLFSLLTVSLAAAGLLGRIFSGTEQEEKKVTGKAENASENPLIPWMQMTPLQRQILRENYHKFKSLSPEAQHEMERRYLFFKSLDPEQQDIVTKKYLFYKNLDPLKREQIRRLHIVWQQMPSAEQQRLILQVEKVRSLPEVERDRELSRSVIWQVFSPGERTSLGTFMKHLQIRIIPFLPNRDQQLTNGTGQTETPEAP